MLTAPPPRGGDRTGAQPSESPTMKIALGPLLYHWPREAVIRFYDGLRDAPVDIVYLGEIVCPRRQAMRLVDWMRIAQRLQMAGKQVVLSTRVFLDSGADLRALQELAENGEFLAEANDMRAVEYLMGRLPFVAGPHLDIDSVHALQWMAKLGAIRWVMPVEMAQDSLADLQAMRPEGVQTEVFAYGRLPLAHSARCFIARHHGRPVDDCGHACIGHPDGMVLKTPHSEGFLVLNGTQTQSARVYNLAAELATLRALGVDVLRLSPQARDMDRVIALFDDARSDRCPPSDAAERMAPYMPDLPCNGFWFGRPALEQGRTAARL